MTELSPAQQRRNVSNALLASESLADVNRDAIRPSAAVIGADGSLFQLLEQPSASLQIGDHYSNTQMSPDDVRGFVERYAPRDTFLDQLRQSANSGDARFLTLHKAVNMAEFQRSALYRDFYIKIGFVQVIAAMVNCGDGFCANICFYRSREVPLFDDWVVDFLESLLPVVVASIRRIIAKQLLARAHQALGELVSHMMKSGVGRASTFAEVFASTSAAWPGAWLSSPRPKDVLPAWMASGMPPPFESNPRDDERLDGLSTRERQIALLVADGLTNAEIAHRCGISKRTAELHVSTILRKSGLRSRTALAVTVKANEP